MKLSEMIGPEAIVANFRPQAQAKAAMIAEMVAEMDRRGVFKGESISVATITQALIAREHDHSTAVGEGFAYPHARLEGLKGFHMALFICKEGLDFSSMDGLPVHFLIFSLVPRDQPNLVFTPRAALTQFLIHSEAQRLKVQNAATDIEVHWLILKDDVEVDKHLLARDLMKPQVTHLTLDMTIEAAANELHRHNIDSLPVVDAEGRLLHEFTCHDLFMFGLPKFFTQLQNISYFKNMNPFEKYFMAAREHKLEEAKPEHETPTIAPDATVMEMLFEMTTRGRHHLYVVDAKGLLLGVIDRHAIVGNLLVIKS